MDDVLIIGGSFAGLAAALQLGRARRRVAVLDTGLPRNRYASAAHGVLGLEGQAPGEILARARAELAALPTVRLLSAGAAEATGEAEDFRVTDTAGTVHAARRLVLAYGVRDKLPPIPGLAECWGKSVLHCPYCHGYEVADRRIGLLYSTPLSIAATRLLGDWSADVALFAHGTEIIAAEKHKLADHGTALYEPAVTALRHEEGQLRAAVFGDGSEQALDVLFLHPELEPAASFGEALGCDFAETALGRHLSVDDKQQTSTSGVFAAGDLSRPRHNISWAIAEGAAAGMFVHQSLVS